MSDEFSVYWWDPEGNSHREASHLDARAAVEFAHRLTLRPAVALGVIRRVIITDGGDFTVFEWKLGEGVTYPGREVS
jgi:hypothetical protein